MSKCCVNKVSACATSNCDVGQGQVAQYTVFTSSIYTILYCTVLYCTSLYCTVFARWHSAQCSHPLSLSSLSCNWKIWSNPPHLPPTILCIISYNAVLLTLLSYISRGQGYSLYPRFVMLDLHCPGGQADDASSLRHVMLPVFSREPETAPISSHISIQHNTWSIENIENIWVMISYFRTVEKMTFFYEV